MFRGMMFDLDGTLADSLKSLAVSCNKALEKFGLPKQPVDAFRQFAGDGPPVLVRRALAAAGDTEGKYYEEVLQEYQKELSHYRTDKIGTFDGIREILQEVKKDGGKLIVVTNKPLERAVELVETLFGSNYFDLIVGYTGQFLRKPDISGTRYAMDSFGLQAKECIYVGDTDVDMKTGKEAGAYTVGVLWGFRERKELVENGADLIISDPLELLKVWENGRK